MDLTIALGRLYSHSFELIPLLLFLLYFLASFPFVFVLSPFKDWILWNVSATPSKGIQQRGSRCLGTRLTSRDIPTDALKSPSLGMEYFIPANSPDRLTGELIPANLPRTLRMMLHLPILTLTA